MIEKFTNKLTNKIEEVSVPLQINIQEVDNGFIVSKAGYQNEQQQTLIRPRSAFAKDHDEVCQILRGYFPVDEPVIVQATDINDLRN